MLTAELMNGVKKLARVATRSAGILMEASVSGFGRIIRFIFRIQDLTITSIILNRWTAFNAWGFPPGMMIISPAPRR